MQTVSREIKRLEAGLPGSQRADSVVNAGDVEKPLPAQ
jgi:hypothetical protein